MKVDPEVGGEHDQLPNVEELRVDHAVPRRARKTKLAIIIGSLLLSIVAVGLIVGLSLRNESKGDDTEGQRESRMVDVVDFLVSAGISDETALATENSPQWNGAKFVADEDRYLRAIPTSMDDEDAHLFIQRYALSVLFFSLNGQFWRSSLRFLSPGSECNDWFQTVIFSGGSRSNYGAFCDENEEVVAIKIPRWRASGHIPPEIGSLSKLQSMDLQFNTQVKGVLPNSMAGLTDLNYLAAHYNDFEGPLPAWIGGLSKLEVLILSNNAFSGTIPASWRRLSNLITLGLDDNLLWGGIQPLRKLSELEEVWLEDNEFQQDLNSIDLSGWTKLVQIDLSDNLFSGSVPSYWFELPTLEVMDLSSNRFSGSLVDNFSAESALSKMFLYNNSLTGEIPNSVANPPYLTHLDLSINNFVGSIPSAIANLSNLTYLFLAQNKFTPGPIPSFLFDMSMLSDLSLKDTQRTGSISEDIGKLDRLVLLDLDRNDLNGTLPTNLGDMNMLELLLLNRNRLSGPIPSEMGQLSKLALLLLDNNTFTGSASALCPLEPTMKHLIADCEGADPELNCTCCTLCCDDDGPSCNDDDLLAEFNPIWEVSYARRDYIFSDNITIED